MEEGAVARLRERFDVVYDRSLGGRREALLEAVRDADALIVRNATRVDAALLAQAGRLEVVGRLGVGLDNIDCVACAERGIEVIPARGANALAVAEYVLAAALVLFRGVFAATQAVADGRWPRTELAGGLEIGGRTIGVVGFGSIGRATAALARAAGMRAIAYDPAVTAADPVWAESGVEPFGLDELLAASDVVSLHVPLVAQTRNLIDASRIARMRDGAVLVNTSRGGIVDEGALAAALRSRHLRGAALDVFEAEPLAAGSALAGCPGLLLTPHVAGLTQEANQRVSDMIAGAVAARLLPSA